MLSKMSVTTRKNFGRQLTREALCLGSTVARLELKGIDGDLHKWWNMLFNAIIRAKSYQFLNIKYTLFKFSCN